jgi:glucose-1-phosphate adenylyltransferase
MAARVISDRDILGVILGGGRGTRLFPLTRDRAKPAVPIAGKFRLVDFPVSNCIHSRIRHIYVLTQFNSVSLHRHLQQSFQFDRFSPGFVHVLAAQQTLRADSWYQGNADAVRQNLRHILGQDFRNILILSGDQLYRMDYRDLHRHHGEKGADITVSVIPVRRREASSLGILKLDGEGRIVRFEEKPKDPQVLDELKMPEAECRKVGLEEGEDWFLASMGIYLFGAESLKDSLDNELTDFGGEIIPASIEAGRTFGYVFNGYWEDVGTIRTFFDANLALCSSRPSFDFFDQGAPMYTHARYLPASKISDTCITTSLIADGCIIQGARIEESVIGVRSFISDETTVSHSIIMGCDSYESVNQELKDDPMGIPHTSIGRGCRIERAIIDKNSHIGEKVTIRDRSGSPDEDGPNYYVRDGIVIIPKGGVVESGTVI